MDFWKDLAALFIEAGKNNVMSNTHRVYLDTLREMTYHIFKAWIENLQEVSSRLKQNEAKKLKSDTEIQQNSDKISIKQTLNQITDSFKQIIEIQLKNEKSLNPEIQEKLQNLSQKIKNNLESLKQLQAENSEQFSENITKLLSQLLQNEQALEQENKFQEVLDKVKEEIENMEKSTLHIWAEEQQFLTMDVSNLDYSWFLDSCENKLDIFTDDFFDYADIKSMYDNSRKELDPLYLIKWKNQSYCDLTWEPASTLRDCERLFSDFDRFNRSLDNASRQKMVGFSYAHGQLKKLFEKKTSKNQNLNQRCMEEIQTRDMLNKLLKFESKIQQGYFQYDYQKNLVPTFRLGQKMKEYQIAGLNWMLRAWQDNRNVVLADEMGLGKTIQSMSLLDHLIKICKIRGPFLIIAPLSTLDHWKRVSEDWTLMNTICYYDAKGAEGRKEIQKNDWYYTDVTNKGTVTQKSKLVKFNVMITSYEVFNADLRDTLLDVPFQFIIVDEAHRLKNKQTKTLTLLKQHPCRKIMLLTGTPIQNNTKELYTLLNYIEPEKFDSFDQFMAEFGELKTKEQIDKLHLILRPHFLRRLKDEVEDSIPPLKETVIDVGLTSIQQQYYKGIYGENLSMLATMGTASLKTASFCNIDIQLRKCCNHLYLLKGVQEDLEKDCKSDQDYFNKILEGSGKMLLLDKFIDKHRQDGHKMLIFSQFQGMVDIIKDYLTFKRVKCEVLTGSVKSQDRIVSIQRFNEDSEFGVFLLTTRAGGLGINLTKARVVIIYDSDWNPQNDLQAIARAHRIGQKFEVEVYRFITDKTYEQIMFDRASRKLGMEQALFQKGAFGDDMTGEIGDDKKASPEEIESLLKYGAFAFLDNDGDEEQQKLTKMNIEDILANKGRDKKGQKKGHQIQKVSFNVDDKNKQNIKNSDQKNESNGTKPDVNDPNFWEKVGLKHDGFTAKQLLRTFKAKRQEITSSHESQSKFMKDVSRCVKGLLDAKLADESRTIDEEIYDLLKRCSKLKDFDEKYKTKASVMLDRVLHFDDYQATMAIQQTIQDGNEEPLDMTLLNLQQNGRRQRAAKADVDYTSNGIKKREMKANSKPAVEVKNASTQGSNKVKESSSQSQGSRKQSKNSEVAKILQELDKDLEIELKQRKKKLFKKKSPAKIKKL